jgi:Chaperone of endosialidase
MTDHQNFKNGVQNFNIFLNDNGDLEFNANGESPDGNTRMTISDLDGQVTIGGSGQFGQIQLRSSTGENTLFLGGGGDETHATLGGGGQSGRVQLNDSSHRLTVDINGEAGVLSLGADGVDGTLNVFSNSGLLAVRASGVNRDLQLFEESGNQRIHLTADDGRLQLLNSAGTATIDLQPEAAVLFLGASGQDGDIFIRDATGFTTINCDGDTGKITCNSLTQTSDGRLKTDIAPLVNSLDNVLALRGVRYRRKGGTAADGQPEIGFVGQEMEGVCPELVSTDPDGFKSVSYSRMTAVLVEAIKEQQQLIREQAAALGDVLRRLSAVEATARP